MSKTNFSYTESSNILGYWSILENTSKSFNAFVQNCIEDKMIDMEEKAAIKEEKQVSNNSESGCALAY